MPHPDLPRERLMTGYLFDLPQPMSLEVEGETARFPLHRIFCVGRNYAAHAAEMGNVVDREAPFYFTKSVQHAIPSGMTVPLAAGTDNYHHEMEFAILIGAPAFKADEAAAADAVFGYCCALDMTRRDLQNAAKEKRRPWCLSKDIEASAVLAPAKRAADFGAVSDQRIWLRVNGELRQDASLAELIHSVPAIVSHLSGYYHLQPGDIILTGTPAGVGQVGAGDVMEGGIDGLPPIALTLSDAE